MRPVSWKPLGSWSASTAPYEALPLSDVHTLLVAMPYTTNYGDGSGGYTQAYLHPYATVNFGSLASMDFTMPWISSLDSFDTS